MSRLMQLIGELVGDLRIECALARQEGKDELVHNCNITIRRLAEIADVAEGERAPRLDCTEQHTLSTSSQITKPDRRGRG
jgi:hypothetical protein